jgi:hypothetical protein
MNQAHPHAPADDPAGWLSLAATPTCAAMALWSSVVDGGPAAMLCSITPSAAPLNGMAAMYLLMAAFHAPPWLRRKPWRSPAATTTPVDANLRAEPRSPKG